MSTPLPTDGVQPEPVEQTAPAEQTAETDYAMHESWARALDESGIPEMLRKPGSPLFEQIRRSEAEANKKIEAVNQAALEPEWKGLVDAAKQNGVAPGDLFTAYNSAAAIQRDPVAFLRSFHKAVQQRVTAGELSWGEGEALKLEAKEAVSEELDLTDPQTRALAEKVERLETERAQELAARQAEQQRIAAEKHADEFIGAIDASLAGAGFAAAGEQTRAAVYRIADSIYYSGNGQYTAPQAAQLAVEQLKAAVAAQQPAAPAPAAAPGIPPVGGRGGTIPGTPAAKFASKQEREAAMIAAGRAALAAE